MPVRRRRALRQTGVRLRGRDRAAGLLVSAASVAWLTRLPLDGQYFWDLFPAFVLGGAGMGLSFVPVTIASLTGVERSDADLGPVAVRLDRVARRFAELIPPGGKPIFLMGDAMPVHLAGRRPYLQQFHEHLMMFTSVRDRTRYARSGLWGLSEIETWLGHEAPYAIIEERTLAFYANRAPYTEHVARIETLLRTHFGLVATVAPAPETVFRVYRRTS